MKIVKTWTLPQVIHSFIGKQEADAADARQQFILTMAAIGCSFSKNGDGVARRILADLEGPGDSLEDVMDTWSEARLKVMFGEKRLKEMGYEEVH